MERRSPSRRASAACAASMSSCAARSRCWAMVRTSRVTTPTSSSRRWRATRADCSASVAAALAALARASLSTSRTTLRATSRCRAMERSSVASQLESTVIRSRRPLRLMRVPWVRFSRPIRVARLRQQLVEFAVDRRRHEDHRGVDDSAGGGVGQDRRQACQEQAAGQQDRTAIGYGAQRVPGPFRTTQTMPSPSFAGRARQAVSAPGPRTQPDEGLHGAFAQALPCRGRGRERRSHG